MGGFGLCWRCYQSEEWQQSRSHRWEGRKGVDIIFLLPLLLLLLFQVNPPATSSIEVVCLSSFATSLNKWRAISAFISDTSYVAFIFILFLQFFKFSFLQKNQRTCVSVPPSSIGAATAQSVGPNWARLNGGN